MVWECWTLPTHIQAWNAASQDWHTPYAENDLRKGGRFTFRMEARDGSEGFDFGGEYTEVTNQQRIAYRMDDGRKVTVDFEDRGSTTRIQEVFEAETQHSVEMQQAGWQAILDNFRNYTEAYARDSEAKRQPPD
jgi:uncharacterized protein YndB with AHSA1/START domain